MPSRAYHEALWESMPAGSQPPDFALRRRFLLERVSAGECVLDVGCGEGWFAIELARAGAEVVGIDVAEEPLRRARQAELVEGSPLGRAEIAGPASAQRADLDLRLVDADGPWPLDDAS